MTWAYWFLDGKAPEIGARSRYRLDEVQAVRGEYVPACAAEIVRVDSPEPLALQGAHLAGCAQHLQYTDGAQKRELDAASRAPIAEAGTIAVLIPIRKRADWWAQPHDARQAHFRGGRDHTTIGLPYAGRIYRKLFHCRYLERAPACDFLTYFEFAPAHVGDFRALLDALRATPEWGYVDLEYEIWMKKA